MPGKLDFTLAPWLPLDPAVPSRAHGAYRDDPFTVTVTIRDSDGDPTNLSSGAFIAQVRTARLTGGTGGTPLADMDVDDTDAATGVLVVGLTQTQTRTLTLASSATAFWDLQDETSGLTYLSGKFKIFDDVSRQ